MYSGAWWAVVYGVAKSWTRLKRLSTLLLLIVITPGFLPGESHGQKGLVGYSPEGYKEWDVTEAVT